MTETPKRWLYLGVFLTSLAAVVFEVTLTRVFSVTLWYHFAYFVVSLALFGLGAGGFAAFFGISASLSRRLFRTTRPGRCARPCRRGSGSTQRPGPS